MTLGVSCDTAAEACDGAEATFAELEASTSELYLLQKRAQVVRKSEAPGGADAAPSGGGRRGSGIATIGTSSSVARPGLVEVESVVARSASSNNATATAARNTLASARSAVPLGKSRSVSAVFVASTNNKIVPLTHAQRLSMLSTAEASELSEFWNLVAIVVCCAVLLVAGGGAIFMNTIESFYSRIVREMVSMGLDFVASHVMGVDVTFNSMEVMVFKGLVRVTNVTIANPPGWKSEYFMNASIMEVRLNLRSLISSHMFRKRTNVDLAAITFRDVTLYVEESESSTNVHDVKAILNGAMPRPERRRRAKLGLEKQGSPCRKLMIADIGASVPVLGRIAPVLHYKDLTKGSACNAKRIRPMVSQILANVIAEAIM